MKVLAQPIYLLLFPVFFVLHAYTEHWLFLDTGELLTLVLRYFLITAVIFAIAWLLYRQKTKAAVFTFILLLIYFLFDAFHDFLKQYSPIPFIAKYTFLLPLLVIVVIYSVVKLYRSNQSFKKLTLYINLLFIILVVADASLLAWRMYKPGSYNRISIVDPVTTTSCTSCNQPDIYLLVFDEYTSSIALKQQYGYNNSQLDTFFTTHGFSIQSQSKSNYNWSEFSMASILNMSYLDIPRPGAISFADYVHAGKLINSNQLTDFLNRQGYQAENYSIFDVNGTKAALENNFRPNTTTLLTNRTFENVILKDIGWHFFTGQKDWKKEAVLYEQRFQNIHNGINLIKKSSEKKSSTPRFIYGHLLMPHAPFYMKGTERETDVQKLFTDGYEYNSAAYLGYLQYTNTVVKDICSTILQNTGGKAVIIVMGDHGFRKYLDNCYPSCFQNMNAVYIPGSTERVLYDSITGVNQFRVILNTLFKQSIPLLKDTCIDLKDEK